MWRTGLRLCIFEAMCREIRGKNEELEIKENLPRGIIMCG